MKIKMLFGDASLPAHMVAETLNGKFIKFLSTPFRKVEEEELSPLPYYRAIGRNAEEAPEYIYRQYGLEK